MSTQRKPLVIIIVVAVVVIIAIIVAALVTASKQSDNQPSSMSGMDMSSMSSDTSSEKAVPTNSVTIQNFAFHPAHITVKAGTKVTWTNNDEIPHSATSDDGVWDTGLLAQGKSGSYTFTKPGTYSYHCTPHPYMKGTVTVTK